MTTSKLLIFLFLFNISFLIAQKIEVKYLANDGFLVKSNEKQILIDAIFTKEFDYLDVLPETELKKFVNKETPYQSIDLLLATHVHGDHFNAELIGKYLLKNKNSQFLGPQEVAIKFKNQFSEFESVESRVNFKTPKLFKSELVSINNIQIEVLRIEHFGTKPWNEAQNVAYIIHLAGKKILHIGDGKIDLKNFESFNLAKKEIDVAILPYWQLGSEEQRSIIETYINPKQILVAHIPLNSQSNSQKNIDTLGYKNTIALIEKFNSYFID